MADQSTTPNKKLLKRLKEAFSGFNRCESIELETAHRLERSKVRIPLKEYPVQLSIGKDGKAVCLYPEKLLNAPPDYNPAHHYLLFNPETYFGSVTGFFRLDEGEKVTLGRQIDHSNVFFQLPKEIDSNPISIWNEEGHILFKALTSDSHACITPLLNDRNVERLLNWRRDKLRRLREIYGGPIKPLGTKCALSLIRDVNELMAQEPYRLKNPQGEPGGLLHLPKKSRVIIVGDLHTRLDNLLVILSQNGFLEALENGQGQLIILGDAVHPEEPDALGEMESSMLIMDFIFRLKIRFPHNVFYIRGNHDSFSEEIGKGGVPQGMLWGKKLNKARGKAYRQEMERFYQQLPYIVYSKHFVATHAAAPTSSPSLEQLIGINGNGKLINEVLNNRIRQANRPSGYSKSDIKRLRKSLGLPGSAPFIVGHTPLSTEGTIWENVGDIENHTIIYSADTSWIGVLVQIEDTIHPLRYRAEQLVPLINSFEE